MTSDDASTAAANLEAFQKGTSNNASDLVNMQSAVAASGALTSLMPAINSPRPTFEPVKRQSGRPQQRGQRNTGPHGTGPHGRPASGTGPGRPRGDAARRSAQNAE